MAEINREIHFSDHNWIQKSKKNLPHLSHC